jgi:predicted nucleic acid-binding Zn ribbon protein
VTNSRQRRTRKMNGIIYLVGLVVVILAVLSFFGLR